jgi:hypothetical protein
MKSLGVNKAELVNKIEMKNKIKAILSQMRMTGDPEIDINYALEKQFKGFKDTVVFEIP